MTSRRPKSSRSLGSSRTQAPAPEPEILPARASDPEVRPATREEIFPVAIAATIVAFIALYVSFTKGYVLLYGDAVAHLAIARRILDSRAPGIAQLGSVWLPLPHLLMLPFVQKMEWWRTGLAGAWPSLACYIFGACGFYRLARRMMAPRWAAAATVFYGLNPNLLYLATTAMTEPLFLALLLWITVLTLEILAAVRSAHLRRARGRLVLLGGLILAAVFTRYDGWILGALTWALVAWAIWRANRTNRSAVRRQLVLPFALFTVLVVAGPLLWVWYNAHFFHDPLDFLRGPYSAAAIERKTTPPGAKKYRGWHNPGWSLLFYTRTAQIDAAFWETGFGLMLAALTGVWGAIRRRIEPAAVLLLWMPLAFYVYSVSYGSVPIFIPELYPHSYYNSRYGLELLPALCLYSVFAAALFERWLASCAAKPDATPRRQQLARLAPKTLPHAVAALAILNLFAQTVILKAIPGHYWRRYETPLVLKEALVNSSTRVPFEEAIARTIEDFPAGVPILMENSAHVGALQDAGIPLAQTVNEGEYYSWHAALQDPAAHAAYVIAIAGDAVSAAVAAHPEGLEELQILCTTGQPCARIYQSHRYGQHPALAAPSAHP